MALTKQEKRQLARRGKWVNLVGAFTVGVGGWFMVGRWGWGIVTALWQILSVFLMVFGIGFVTFCAVWLAGMIIPGYLVRRDAVDDVLMGLRKDQDAGYQERLEGTG